MRNKGFTLIELMVVFAIIFIGSTAGIATFSKFGEAKKLDSAAAEFESLLNNARINAVTQTSPPSPIACTDAQGFTQMQKYGITITNNQTYEMGVCCNGVRSTINNKVFKLPAGVRFSVNSDNIYFKVATGTSNTGVPVCTSNSSVLKTITLIGVSGSKWIRIDTAGNITKQQ